MDIFVGLIETALVVSFIVFVLNKLIPISKSTYHFIYRILYGEPINTETRYYSSTRWEKYEIK